MGGGTAKNKTFPLFLGEFEKKPSLQNRGKKRGRSRKEGGGGIDGRKMNPGRRKRGSLIEGGGLSD